MEIYNLVLEVTRKCQLTCTHCLRGPAQRVTISDEVLDALLENVSSVSELTITGGEPTLYDIGNLLNHFKKHQVILNSFYMATNSYLITEKTVLDILRLVNYCEEPEACTIEYSNDMFHGNEVYNPDLELLSGLACFKKKYEKDFYEYAPKFTGNAVGNLPETMCEEFENKPTAPFYREDLLENTTFYVSALGGILTGCDFSYDVIDKNNLCTVFTLGEYMNTLEC